jgi:hypothetical protein
MPEMPAPTLPPVPGDTTRPMSLLSRVIGMLISPRATFQWVVAHPTWLPMVLFTAGFAAVAMGAFLSTEAGQQAYVDQSVSSLESWGRTVDDEGYAAIERQAALSRYINPAAILVISPIMTALIAVLLYGLCSALYGGTATYKQMLAVVAHSGAITVVQQLFSMPLNYARQSLSSPTNLSVFFPMLEEDSVLSALLGSIDLFIVWWVLVLAVGLSVLYKRPTRSTATVLFVVYALIAAGFALAKAAFSGA